MEDKENVQRVDLRPASVYSVVVFLLIFTLVYIFFPQISMYIPFLGENVEKDMGYSAVALEDINDAKYIIIADAVEFGDTVTEINGNNADVYRLVRFDNVKALKGEPKENLILKELGGSTLISSNGGRGKKYTVEYENAASYSENSTYLLFTDENYQVINGKYGAFKMGSDGSFTDYMKNVYTENDIIKLISEGKL